MKRFFNFFKPFSKDDISLVGGHVYSNLVAYILILSLISIFEIVMLIRGIFIFDFAKFHHFAYFLSYIILLFFSLALIIVILLFKKHNKRELVYYNLLWIYSFVLFAWAFLVSYIDMSGDHSAIVYLTIMATLSGIVLLNPVIYNVILIPSVIALFVINGFNHFAFIESIGDYINIIVFILMAIIMNVRLYKVSKSDYLEKVQLNLATITDSLTGLGNENRYLRCVHKLETEIKEEKDTKFIIVMMDVNNLKATNDKYGHRYGCNLIVQAGHILPKIFKHSNLFHIGGDEFIAIIERGLDYDNFEECLNNFKRQLEYQLITYSGVELPLSVAIGYAKYKKGMIYGDVLQEADGNMYQNKKEIKEKYNFAGR